MKKWSHLEGITVIQDPSYREYPLVKLLGKSQSERLYTAKKKLVFLKFTTTSTKDASEIQKFDT